MIGGLVRPTQGETYSRVAAQLLEEVPRHGAPPVFHLSKFAIEARVQRYIGTYYLTPMFSASVSVPPCSGLGKASTVFSRGRVDICITKCSCFCTACSKGLHQPELLQELRLGCHARNYPITQCEDPVPGRNFVLQPRTMDLILLDPEHLLNWLPESWSEDAEPTLR